MIQHYFEEEWYLVLTKFIRNSRFKPFDQRPVTTFNFPLNAWSRLRFFSPSHPPFARPEIGNRHSWSSPSYPQGGLERIDYTGWAAPAGSLSSAIAGSAGRPPTLASSAQNLPVLSLHDWSAYSRVLPPLLAVPYSARAEHWFRPLKQKTFPKFLCFSAGFAMTYAKAKFEIAT